MGFFKSIGNKLKRVISIKNAINLGTGNFSAVAKDAVRVATTGNDKVKKFAIPEPVTNVLDKYGSDFKSNVQNKLANNPTVQDASGVFTKVYLQALYIKYKTWIYVGVGLIGVFVIYKFGFAKKSSRRVASRR